MPHCGQREIGGRLKRKTRAEAAKPRRAFGKPQAFTLIYFFFAAFLGAAFFAAAFLGAAFFGAAFFGTAFFGAAFLAACQRLPTRAARFQARPRPRTVQ